MTTLSTKIARLRKEKNISQAELAKVAQVSRDAISKYERGEIIPSVETAKKIADALDVNLDFLVSLDEKEAIIDKAMLWRMRQMQELQEQERDSILLVLDAFIRDAKTRQTYISR